MNGRDTSLVNHHRLWMPFSIGVLAFAAIVLVRLKPELEYNFASWFIAAIVLLAILLELVWFLFLSRFKWRLRLIAFGILALSIFGLTRTLRVDGTVSGNGLPKLAWRWTAARAPLPSALPLALGASSRAAPESTSDSPQFFGPHRDGIVTNAGLSHDWKTTPPKQLWRQPIGAGWSAFAVVGGRAYTQEQRGEAECVTCYDLLTGRLIWTHSNAVHFSQWQSGDGPHATPSVFQGKVFTMGAAGMLNCLEAETGQQLWSRNVLAENNLPNLTWGTSDSPLVFDDTVVVTGGQTNGPTVLAYRRADGKPLWRAGTARASYASPILTTLAGRRMVLSCNAASLTAHDPATGETLLDYPWTTDKWPKASQPVVIDGQRVFLSAGYGSGCMLLEVKAGADQKLAATPLWQNMRMKTQFNSAAAWNGFLYGLDDGLLACVEISTGERKWKDGRYGSGQTLLVDDLILIQSEQGDVALAEAKPDSFNELGRIAALHNKTWNQPTLAGRYLLVRNNEEAVCYELPVQKKESSLAALRLRLLPFGPDASKF
ncbi:MAG TPA: PQQ-binding-like beta-propeller repeat protein [Candidatus Saccharimonadales bacterium]|nr:PQQ-binding-like beta-propeller repeat protein [Candidatus Saccharimonadales bacterium]